MGLLRAQQRGWFQGFSGWLLLFVGPAVGLLFGPSSHVPDATCASGMNPTRGQFGPFQPGGSRPACDWQVEFGVGAIATIESYRSGHELDRFAGASHDW